MGRPRWFVQLIEMAYPGRFLAARATRLPILGRLIDRWFFDGDCVIYLPKDRLVPIDQPIEVPGEMVLPSQLVEYFIQQAHTHWIMNSCICRVANNCQSYPRDLGCLFLGRAALGINPELGRRVTREEALEHVRRCREAGLIHMIGRNKMDTIWLGVGPGTELLTICHCCPCCCLWGVLPHLGPEVGARLIATPGVTVAVNGLCVGCGACTQGVCFADAIHLVDGGAVIGDACRGCGRCVDACPQGAIEISIDTTQLMQGSIARFSSLVDLA